MISETLDLGRFLETIRDKDYRDIMYLVEQEATETERFSYRQNKRDACQAQPFSSYARTLKDFLFFMRYGVRPAGLTDADFQLFQSVSEDVERKRPFRNQCDMMY